jgi:hypothetical protein
MRKKWAVGICAAAVIAAAAGGARAASASTSAPSPENGEHTFTVYTHMIEAHVITPCSTCATPTLAKGSEVSAEYVNDPVFSTAANTRQIGQEALVISIVASDASVALLNGAVDFTADGLSGELAVEGEIDPLDSSGVVAITGGTGSFQKAKGEVDYSGAGLKSTETTLVIHLQS